MSASSQIAVLLENEVLVASPESDAIQVEGSEFACPSLDLDMTSSRDPNMLVGG